MQSLTLIYQSIYFMNYEVLIRSGIRTLLHSLLIFKWRKKMNRHAWRNLGICKSFAKHFRQVGQNIHSVKKKKGGGRSRQEKPLKFLIFRKMVTLSHLMADKCCLPVTWTECRWAICVSKLSRLQDWKAQDSKSSNYLYFLESAHGAASCRDVPGSRAWALSTFWRCSRQLFAHPG